MQREAPDIGRLLGALADYDVQYVLAGSVAVGAWGADVGNPGDLDIVPATDEINLTKLQEALGALDARPFAVTGEWTATSDGHEWQEFEHSDPRRSVSTPPLDPLRPESFDSLFETTYGALDIVPVVSGVYSDIAPRATELAVYGVTNVQVMSIEDLLAQLTIPRRKKDATRVAQLRLRQRSHL